MSYSYSQSLLQQGSFLTRLAHRSRFDAVLNILDNHKYKLALDFGCADGLLLKTAYDRGIICSGIGVDVNNSMLLSCQKMFKDINGFQFLTPNEMTQKISPQSCDLILCTETLEHIGYPAKTLHLMLNYCQPKAKIIISVPLEIGPTLFFKQIGRYFASLKGNYVYEKYTLKELYSSAILWDVSSFPSPHSMQSEYTGHKGFDYRKVEKLLQEKVKIERTIFSPFSWSNNILNSTVIWICTVESI
jgi:2-polyprenyl-3-methyl-5-hydroxy-6-metoxy-1,4-benzoquinol methylase